MQPLTRNQVTSIKKSCNTILFRKDIRKRDILNFRVDSELYQKIQEKSKEYGGISNLIRVAVLEKFGEKSKENNLQRQIYSSNIYNKISKGRD